MPLLFDMNQNFSVSIRLRCDNNMPFLAFREGQSGQPLLVQANKIVFNFHKKAEGSALTFDFPWQKNKWVC